MKRHLRIVSGGQTGADRAAFNWAIRHRVPHGGWCPRGRRAEDGIIPARYRLKETPRRSYLQRTEFNVRDSDATVIVSVARALRGGSAKALAFARKYHKPCLHISKEAAGAEAGLLLRRFIRQHQVRILNVAGPRASEEPKVGRFVRKVLSALR